MKVTVHDPLHFEVLDTGLGFTEGPVIADDGAVLIVDIDGGRVLRLDGGETTVVATPGGGPNGMALETPTTAIVANNGGFLWSDLEDGTRIPIDRSTHTNEPLGFSGGWIERVDLTSGAVTVLHRQCGGAALRGPNDLVFDEAGGLWFTDHGKGRHESLDRGGLYYVPPDGGAVRRSHSRCSAQTAWACRPTAGACTSQRRTAGGSGPGTSQDQVRWRPPVDRWRCVTAASAWRRRPTRSTRSPSRTTGGRDRRDHRWDRRDHSDGREATVHPVPGDMTTNIAFGGADRRRAVITLSRSGASVETTWPRPGLVVVGTSVTTVAEVLRGHATYDGDALYFEEHTWTYRQLVDEASRCPRLSSTFATAAALLTSACCSTMSRTTSSGSPLRPCREAWSWASTRPTVATGWHS